MAANRLHAVALAVTSLLVIQAALANPGQGRGPPDGRGQGGGAGKANGHGHANEAAINKDVPGLIDGCLAPDYEGIKAFFGYEYAMQQVAKGLLKKPDGDDSDQPSSRGTVGFENWLWRRNVGPDGMFQVPYEFASDHTFPADQVQTIHNSFAALGASVGILNFRAKQPSDTEWITVQSGSGCWSYIGRSSLASGGQPLNLQPNVNGWGCVWQGTIQHEMMHALGFYHEQSRPDRDDYVTINFENIQAGKEGNFQKSTNINSLGSAYDYGSVMHYGKTAFAKSSGLITIDARGNTIGQRNGASATDVDQIRLLYQCSSGIRDLASYLAEPCATDCKCAEGMTGCGGNDDACYGSLVCSGDVCSQGAPTPSPTTAAPTPSPTPAPTPAPTTPAPTQACGARGDWCQRKSDCCSNKCHRRRGCR